MYFLFLILVFYMIEWLIPTIVVHDNNLFLFNVGVLYDMA